MHVFLLECAQQVDALAMVVLRAVAEVEPEDVGAGLEQCAQALAAGRSGPSVATILVKRSRYMPKSLLPRRRNFEVAGLLVDLDHSCRHRPPPAGAGRGKEELVRRCRHRQRQPMFVTVFSTSPRSLTKISTADNGE